MPEDRPTSEHIPLTEWLWRLGGILGPPGGSGLTEGERTALLDTVPTAAHASEAIAALSTTFMAGADSTRTHVA